MAGMPEYSSFDVRADKTEVWWLVDGGAWLADAADPGRTTAADAQTALVDTACQTIEAVAPHARAHLVLAFDIYSLMPLHASVRALSPFGARLHASLAQTPRLLTPAERDDLPGSDACASVHLEWPWRQHLMRVLRCRNSKATITMTHAPHASLFEDDAGAYQRAYTTVLNAVLHTLPKTDDASLARPLAAAVLGQQLLVSPDVCRERTIGSGSADEAAGRTCDPKQLTRQVTRTPVAVGEAIGQLLPRIVGALTLAKPPRTVVVASSRSDALVLILGALAQAYAGQPMLEHRCFLAQDAGAHSFLDIGAFFNWLCQHCLDRDALYETTVAIPRGFVGYVLSMAVGNGDDRLTDALIKEDAFSRVLVRTHGSKTLIVHTDDAVEWYVKAWARILLPAPHVPTARVPVLALVREARVARVSLRLDTIGDIIASHLHRLLTGVATASRRDMYDTVFSRYAINSRGFGHALWRVPADMVIAFLGDTQNTRRFHIDLRILKSPWYVWTTTR